MSRTKGFNLTQEHKRKISVALTGNRNGGRFKDPITRGLRISRSRLLRKKKLGYINSPETRKKMSLAKQGKPSWNKGKKWSKATRNKMSEAQFKRFSDKTRHPRWLGGESFEPYPVVFDRKLKLAIRKRDGFTCQLCKVKEKDYFQTLSIHHIDYDKNNCNENNLFTLCRSCNGRVNKDRAIWTKFFKEKVQRL